MRFTLFFGWLILRSYLSWRAMKYLGLRVESGQCKTALLSYRKGNVVVHELTSYPSIQAFLERKRLSRVVCGIEEKEVLIKKINTPNNTPRILKKVAPFQIETHFELSTHDFFFHPFSCYSSSTFIAAVSKKSIDRVITQFDPSVITTEQSALLHFAKEYAEEYHSLCILFSKRDEVVCVTLEKGSFGRSATFSLEEPDGVVDQIMQCMSAKRRLPLLFLGSSRTRKVLREAFEKREDSFQIVSLSLPEAQLEYALEIGCALEGLYPEQMSVQFRKGSRTPREEKRRFKRGLVSISFACALLAGVSYYALASLYEKMAMDLNHRVDTLIGSYPDLFGEAPNGWKVLERIDTLHALQKKVPASKKYIEPFVGFTGIYALVSTLAKEKGFIMHKVAYRLDSYPTIKKAKEKYAGEICLQVETEDPIKVKEFCEELSQKEPFQNGKGITMRRDTHGFSITCSFIE